MADKASTWDRLAVIAAMSEEAPNGYLNRTAVMKCAYLLQTIRQVPLGYHFTLYSHGPYRSDVLNDLDYAEMLGAVEVSQVSYPGGYGYKIKPGTGADRIKQMGAAFLEKHRDDIDWCLREFGGRRSAELELAGTIIYADREAPPASQTQSELARKVREVKPHFSEQQVRAEVESLHQKKLLRSVREEAGRRT